MMKRFFVTLLSCIACNTVSASLWQDTSGADQRQLRDTPALQAQQNQVFRFDEARLLNLDMDSLNHHLDSAMPEDSVSTNSIQLPLPNGEFADYFLYQSPVMAPGLAAKYPDIRTFKVIGTDNAAYTGRLDLTPQGFHAVLRRNNETIFIDPLGNSNHYQSYYKRDFAARKTKSPQHKTFICRSGNHNAAIQSFADKLVQTTTPRAARLSFGNQIKTYRLAIAATGEFTQFHGGTKAQGLAALVTGINRINEVYERDLAVKLEIINNNDQIVYTDADNDPFDGSADLADLAITTINQSIGAANYDVGHVVSGEGSGGQANLGVICANGTKAGGETSSDSPVNDPFFIDYVAHELGHQFGSEHSFNAVSEACGGGNRSSNHAYEPASGSTIMAYAGICAPENLQQNSDAYFHSDSIEQIRNHLDNGSGNTCGVAGGNTNTPPDATAGTDKVIPKQTPFSLTGSGSDTDGDTLTYTWEQLDLGPATSSRGGLVDNGSSPIFRSFMPGTSPTRIFPQLSSILNNTTTYGEVMPTQSRELNFRLTVRDGKGGVASDDLRLQVVSAAGPFKVTLPESTSWTDGSQTITWDVANTTAAPLSCSMVKIDLSTNNGASFPTTLIASTENDGSATVTVPAVSTTNGRVRISCTSQPFFAINTGKITITSDGTGNGTNEAPVALNDSFTFSQSGNTRRLDVLKNDSDENGDALTISKITGAGNHIINIASDNKSINFKHAAGFSGTVTFSYTITDGTAEASANVSINITAPEPENEIPVANPDQYDVKANSEEITLNLLDNDTDADGDELTIIRINSVSDGGSVTIAEDGKSVSYQPADGFTGTEIINYAIRDTYGDTGSANVKITVSESDENNDGGGGSSGPYLLLSLLFFATARRAYRSLFACGQTE
ncbi:MAG: Ig-like domain-containing protein [Thiolinea sp.]